ncbi:response regulator [Pseudoduganella sp. OTU4001]|uniref:response regulator n=1 Tax=Pseudoduganella sp. OTU4001 TaxID=3043854 RepID=UPI00313BADCF
MLARSSSLFWKLFLPIGALLVLCGLVVSALLPILITENAERDAVDGAQATVRQFLVLRKYYTENVAARVLAHSDMQVDPDYRNKENAIPLPATMIHDLSALMQGSGTSVKLYSPFPFPQRRERASDQFAQDAWSYLQKTPDGVFSRTETVNGKTTVRVALADRMSAQACVACHNSHPQSPKTDWKLGDVRGVLEVNSTREAASAARIASWVMIALGATLLLVAVALRVFYQRNVAQPLHRALDSARALAGSRAGHVNAVQAVADGNLEHDFAPAPLPQIDLRGVAHDEAGDLLQSVAALAEAQHSFDQAFAQMTQALRASNLAERERDWLKSSQNELNTVMRGEQELAELGQRILTYVAERLGARVGSLYVDEGQGQGMRLLAGYGLVQGQHPAQLVPGEGMAGQALRDGKRVLLDAAPPGYLSIGSALGSAGPSSVLVLPLQHGRNMVGLMELGSFRPFSDNELAFVDSCAEVMAIGLEVNITRQRTRALLAETAQQAEELRVQQEELQQSNSELEERADQLERQREEIQRVSAYKSEFMANMSHELRTPLNSMLILSSLLRENKGRNLDERQLEYAGTIHNAGRDLLNLINDILDLAKMEAGKVELHIEPVELAGLCDELVAQFRPQAEQKGLVLQVERAPGTPQSVPMDRQRVQQVLRNLLANALKFTHAGSVVLRIAVVGEQLSFAVSDTGIGVPADKQVMIFEAFRQADGSISRHYGGTGLGLSISLQLARTMGGALHLHSKEGEGSTFTFMLPLQPEAGGAPGAAAWPGAGQPALTAGAAGLDAGAAAAVRGTDLVGRRILIVEDDPVFAGILADLVLARGYQPMVASDGEQGLALARYEAPHAVLLDVMMPGMDGWEVMRQLREDPRTCHLPVHFITCLDELQRARDLGAIGLLTKPATPEQLAQVFDTVESAWAATLKRVLVVEDDEGQLSSLAALLAARDVEVVRARGGREALQLLQQSHFDCMVLDLGLQDMSGYAVLEQLQANPQLRQLPVVIHSGQDLSREQLRMLNRYARSVIIKGTHSPERLLGEVQLFLHSVEKGDRGVQQEPFALAGCKVLVVDDDMRNLFSLASLLGERGVQVVEAEHGLEALEKLKDEENFDAVLMDIMMPQMDGYEAMRRIRADARFKDLPIIAMTAKAMPGDHQKCLEAGASDYLAKPIDTQQLLSLLRVWIRRQGSA